LPWFEVYKWKQKREGEWFMMILFCPQAIIKRQIKNNICTTIKLFSPQTSKDARYDEEMGGACSLEYS